MPHLQIFQSEDESVKRELTDDKITVGRLADNMVQIDDGSVSSRHAELSLEGGSYQVHDLGSTNGTFVNGEQIVDATLRNGDEVRFGKIECVFLAEDDLGDGQPLPETAGISSEVAQLSVRPENFKNSSPFPKTVKGKEPIVLAAVILAAIGVLSFLGAMFSILQMEGAV